MSVLSLVLASVGLATAGNVEPRMVAPDAGSVDLLAADAEVVEVVSDPLARWNHTRWRIDSQIGVPYPAVLYAEIDHELQFVSLDLHLVASCDLDGEQVRGRGEATCTVQDAAISAGPWLQHPAFAQQVLDETDERLTGLRVQLQVDAAGRVLDVGLLDKPQTNQRVNAIYENLRQIVARAFFGFHAQLPEHLTVGEDVVERGTRLLSIPVFRYSTASMVTGTGLLGIREPVGASDVLAPIEAPSGDRRITVAPRTPSNASLMLTHDRHPLEVLLAPASFGRSTAVSRLDVWKNSYILQTTATGTADVGADIPMVFQGDMSAVAVYEPTLGFMTERRWTVRMSPTASSSLSDGPNGWAFWQIGSLQLLGQDEASPLGESRLVAPPQTERGNLPPWPSL